MLKIGNVELPTPKDVDYSYNKLWSENSGRLDSGDFVGELIAIKRKYVVTFPLLSPTELALVRNACAQAFATVTITDVDGGDAVLECYFGDVTVRAYSWNGKFRYAVDCKVSMIER